MVNPSAISTTMQPFINISTNITSSLGMPFGNSIHSVFSMPILDSSSRMPLWNCPRIDVQSMKVFPKHHRHHRQVPLHVTLAQISDENSLGKSFGFISFPSAFPQTATAAAAGRSTIRPTPPSIRALRSSLAAAAAQEQKQQPLPAATVATAAASKKSVKEDQEKPSTSVDERNTTTATATASRPTTAAAAAMSSAQSSSDDDVTPHQHDTPVVVALDKTRTTTAFIASKASLGVPRTPEAFDEEVDSIRESPFLCQTLYEEGFTRHVADGPAEVFVMTESATSDDGTEAVAINVPTGSTLVVVSDGIVEIAPPSTEAEESEASSTNIQLDCKPNTVLAMRDKESNTFQYASNISECSGDGVQRVAVSQVDLAPCHKYKSSSLDESSKNLQRFSFTESLSSESVVEGAAHNNNNVASTKTRSTTSRSSRRTTPIGSIY